MEQNTISPLLKTPWDCTCSYHPVEQCPTHLHARLMYEMLKAMVVRSYNPPELRKQAHALLKAVDSPIENREERS